VPGAERSLADERDLRILSTPPHPCCYPSLFFEVCWRGLAGRPQPGRLCCLCLLLWEALMAHGTCPALSCSALPPCPLIDGPGFNLLTAAACGWRTAPRHQREVGRSETGPTGLRAAGLPKRSKVAREASLRL
jgi:hypothetical protein